MTISPQTKPFKWMVAIYIAVLIRYRLGASIEEEIAKTIERLKNHKSPIDTLPIIAIHMYIIDDLWFLVRSY